MEINKYEEHKLRCTQCGFTFTKKKSYFQNILNRLLTNMEMSFAIWIVITGS